MCAKCEVSRILNGAEMSQTHDRSTHQTPVCLFVSPFVSSPFFFAVDAFAITNTHTRAHTNAPSLEKYYCIVKCRAEKCHPCVHACVYGKAEPVIW